MTIARYRLAVVMFTDIVGSTEQRQRLGNDRAEELRVAVDRLQLDVITGHHGAFVKHLGDGMMATFESATDAVNAAVTLQAEMQRASHRLPEPTTLRIGVAAGDVTTEYSDLFGMAPIIAARLCAAAEGGTALVDDLTRQLVSGETEVPFVDSTVLDLKGVSAPVLTWMLRPAPVEELAPLPGPLRDDARFVFVGRSAESARLRELWQSAGAGERQVVVISGEAGVGKTRLVAQLAAHVRDGGGGVLYGRNDPDLVAPYQPFAEALRGYVADMPASMAAARLGRGAAHLTRLVPELQEVVGEPPAPAADPDAERLQLFEAVIQWLVTASASAPMLLVVDDLHWAAEPTLQLLRYIGRSTSTMSVAVVCTARDETPDGMSVDHLMSRLAGSDVREVRLDGFDEHTTLQFIEAAARHSFGDEGRQLAKLVRDQTSGNALFTRELLLHLVETGALTQVDGRWSTNEALARTGIPDGIRRVVTERVARLSDAAQQVIEWAAVVGEVIDDRVLAADDLMDVGTLFAALQECCAARLLGEESAHRFRFTHGLVRSTLYHSLGPTRRLLLHRRTADVLLRLSGDDPMPRLAELAYHTAQAAGDGLHREAVKFNTMAGDRAMQQVAASDAVGFYRAALQVLEASPAPDQALRCDLLTSLARAQMQSGNPGFEEALADAAEAARRLRDAERFAAVVLAGSRGAATASGLVDLERVAIVDEALRMLGDGDHPSRARLLGLKAAELHFGGVSPDVVALTDEAIGMARRVDDPSTVAFVLVQRVAALRSSEHIARRRADLVELVDLSRELGDPLTEVLTASRLAEISFESARYDELVRALDRAADVLVGMGDASHSHLELRVMRNRAELAMLRGEVDESARLLESMMQLAEEVGLTRQVVAGYMGNITKARVAQGRAAETIALWRQLSTGFGDTFLPGLGAVLSDCGQHDEAATVYRRFAEDGFASVTRDLTYLHNLAFLVTLCRRYGSVIEAAVLERLLEPHAELIAYGGAGCYGSVAHFLGLAALQQSDLDRADWWFDKAVQVNASMHAPLLQASTLIARAELLDLRAHGADHERAEVLRREAADIAFAHGAPGLAARAVAGPTVRPA